MSDEIYCAAFSCDKLGEVELERNGVTLWLCSEHYNHFSKTLKTKPNITPELREALKGAINTGTAIIFLNQQWLALFRNKFAQLDALDITLKELIEHAKEQNREAFNKINNLSACLNERVKERKE